jgi:hypothetical protein
MVPWVWFTTGDWVLIGYTAAMGLLYAGALTPELRQYARLKREGRLAALDNAQIEGGPRRGAGLLRDDADLPSLRRFLRLGRPARTEKE